MPLSKLVSEVRHPSAPKPKKPLGAGDAVALVAQPIAKAIDFVLPTDLANCVPCGERKSDWNVAIPDIAAVPGQLIELGKEVLKGLVQ